MILTESTSANHAEYITHFSHIRIIREISDTDTNKVITITLHVTWEIYPVFSLCVVTSSLPIIKQKLTHRTQTREYIAMKP